LRTIIGILRKDLKKRIGSPWGIIILMSIPLIMTSLFGVAFGGNGEENVKIKMLVENRDNGFISEFIIKSLDMPEVKKFINIKIVEIGSGEDKIIGKEASALLIIPENFTKDFVDQRKKELLLIKNPSEQFFPPVIEDLSRMLTKLLSAVSIIFHDEVSVIADIFEHNSNRMDELKFKRIFNGSFDKIKRIRKFLSPLLLSFKSVTVNKKEKKRFNIFSMLLPPISIMFLMFIIETFLRDILEEKENGTMQRILYSPIKPSDYIISKILSGWISGILMFILMIVFGVLLFGISWGNYLYLSVLIIATAFTISSFFAFLNSILKNKNQVASISAPLILIMSAVGGSMIPHSMLPAFIKKISFLSINYWFMDGSNKILEMEFPLKNIVIISVIGIVLFVLSYKLLVKRVSV